METRNDRVERSRRTILAMLDSAVELNEAPEMQELLSDYGADEVNYPDSRPREHALKDDNPFYIRDYSQCVLCWRCVQVCAEDAQFTFALTLGERGYDTRVATSYEVAMPESPCVFCGQCIGVCPTGASNPKWNGACNKAYLLLKFVIPPANHAAAAPAIKAPREQTARRFPPAALLAA